MLRFLLASSPIFAVVAIGWVAARLGLLAPAGIAAFTAYAFDLALPALVTSLLGAGALVFGATAAVSIAARSGPGRAGAHAQAATNGNLGFLGVPLLLS